MIYLESVISLLVSIYIIIYILFPLIISYLALISRKKKHLYFIEKKTLKVGNIKLKKTFKDSIINLVFSIIWYSSNLISKIPSYQLRVFLYKNIFKMKIANKSSVYHGCEIINPWNISIDEGSIIGIENKIDGRGNIFIGKHVNMSHQVNIWTMQHSVNSPKFEGVIGSVSIGDYVWLGNRVTILPGVKIAKGCIISSGSIVSKDTEEYGIYAGIPAKRIAKRNKNLKYDIGILPIL